MTSYRAVMVLLRSKAEPDSPRPHSGPPVIVMQPHLATANPFLQPASPAALFMSTNQDLSSGVLATLPVTSLP